MLRKLRIAFHFTLGFILTLFIAIGKLLKILFLRILYKLRGKRELTKRELQKLHRKDIQQTFPKRYKTGKQAKRFQKKFRRDNPEYKDY